MVDKFSIVVTSGGEMRKWNGRLPSPQRKIISYYIPRECSLDFVSLLSALMVLFISFLAMLFSVYFTSF